jgi:hypothetical protein
MVKQAHIPGILGLILATALVVTLPACTLTGGDDGARSAAAVQAELAADLQAVQDAQVAALLLWDRVIFGEVVSCQDMIAVPDPVALPAADRDAYAQAAAIQDRLNLALHDVRQSADLWNIECGIDRPLVPLEMAREGRATALAATTLLDEAAALLAAWMPPPDAGPPPG